MEDEVETFIIDTVKDANNKDIPVVQSDLSHLAKVRFGLKREEAIDIVKHLFDSGALVNSLSGEVLAR